MKQFFEEEIDKLTPQPSIIKSFRERFPTVIYRIMQSSDGTQNQIMFENIKYNIEQFLIEMDAQIRKEIASEVEKYFDGLILIPDPQATGKNLIELIINSEAKPR
jgi:hypothetical protein